MDEQYKKWLNDLKVGDTVVVERSWQPGVPTVSRVLEVLPEGVHILEKFDAHDRVFDGGLCKFDTTDPDAYTIKMLVPTPARLEDISLRWWRTLLGAVDWFDVDDDMIRVMREALKEVKWQRK
jgi:hypothetical protein